MDVADLVRPLRTLLRRLEWLLRRLEWLLRRLEWLLRRLEWKRGVRMPSPLRWIGVAVVLLSPVSAVAIGDGPRAQALLPTGVNFFAPTVMDLDGNFNFNGNILVPDADIDGQVFVASYLRAFDLGGRYAQVYVNPLYGKLKGSGAVPAPGSGQLTPVNVEESGFADPIVSFKFGLIGMQPLSLPEYATRTPGFEMAVFASVTIPVGEYHSDELVNLGANVWSLRLGLPMTIPLGSPLTALELHPSVTVYEDNNDPTRGADKLEQEPLLVVESHLTHNFTSKLWGSLDLGYRYGGETTTDGVDDDNKSDSLGGGASLGYALSPKVSVQGSLGKIFAENDGSRQQMLRMKLAWMF